LKGALVLAGRFLIKFNGIISNFKQRLFIHQNRFVGAGGSYSYDKKQVLIEFFFEIKFKIYQF
jgi:hypothetical protein